jgi:hypothetical protein
MSRLAASAPSYPAACHVFSPLLGRSLPGTLSHFFPSFPDQQTGLFRTMYSGSCLPVVRWFSPWVLMVSFCHMDEPMGTEFRSSTYLLFPIQTQISSRQIILFACWFFAKCISSTLKMEAICSSETSVETQRTTRCHIPEDDTLHNHHCGNLKS